MGDDPVAQWMVGFDQELNLLMGAIDAARSGDGSADGDVLLQHLQTAEEELRVADAEVRRQQDQVSRLVRSQQARRWQHERLLAVLPSPIVVTNDVGAIKSVNSAAASLLGMRIDQMLRRPVQSLMDPSDRPNLRRELSRVVRQDDGSFRRLVTLSRRHGEPLSVEAVATVQRDVVTDEVEVTWLLLAPREHAALTQHTDAATTVARALVDLTQLPLQTREPGAVLSTTASICRRALGDSVEVSVSVGEPVEPQQVASTDSLAQKIDGAQVRAGEGPCEEAWQSREVVVSTDLHTDRRWPRLAHAVSGLPVAGAIAVPVIVGDELLGALNIYSREEISAEQAATAELLATAVAAILYEFEVKAELESTARNFQTALTSRATIDQAKRVLMLMLGYDADQAFSLLVSISSRHNRKLRDIAAELVESAATRQADGVLAGLLDTPPAETRPS